MSETLIITAGAAQLVEAPSITTVAVTAAAVQPEVQTEQLTISLGAEQVLLTLTPPDDEFDAPTALEDLANVSGEGRAHFSLLMFDQPANRWRPTNSPDGQMYDGGNF